MTGYSVRVITCAIRILILEPKVFATNAILFRSYNQQTFEQATGIARTRPGQPFRSIRNTLRGLHYQIRPRKLIRVVAGKSSTWR